MVCQGLLYGQISSTTLPVVVGSNDSDHRACANDLTICFHAERTLRCIVLFGVLNARQRTVNVVVETYLPSGAIPTRRSVLPSRSP